MPMKGVKPVAQEEQLLTPLQFRQLAVLHWMQLCPPGKMLKLESQEAQTRAEEQKTQLTMLQSTQSVNARFSLKPVTHDAHVVVELQMSQNGMFVLHCDSAATTRLPTSSSTVRRVNDEARGPVISESIKLMVYIN